MGISRTIYTAIVVGLSVIAPSQHWADTLQCGIPTVTVTFEDVQDGGLICDAVRQAKALFDQCGLPPLSSPVHIKVVEELSQSCVAMYHCGENKIEVLSSPKMQERRDQKGAFAHLPPHDYLRSVVVHELSHAATDNMPCPFEACVATEEYIAYAMQVMSLSPEARTVFEDRSELGKSISVDELSAIILFMDPHLFARKVWAHLSQRDDPCGYIGHLLDGSVLLDRERF